ncbi:hypothetical protein MTR67_003347 [Solanum verrucosum]|uniref:Uncharacterized protein n=1 Tax=Solanum verrucosum TaxID=315347 RepID=A0AAF0PSN3_SOLVR|nr:hypothetical protein MTR67_003347 [Solanum verrucosum]
MAAQRDLAKIGSEGFALIDEYFGKKRIVNRPRTTVAHNMAAGTSTTFRATQQNCNHHYSSAETRVYQSQVGERNEQLTDRRVVPRCSVRSPKVTDLEDAEGQDKEAMKLAKGRIAEWIGELDLLR